MDTPWEILKLEANYRSDVAICVAAQRLIEHNTDRVGKATLSVSGDPGSVVVFEHRDPHGELAWIAGEVKAHEPSNCAVLVRTNHLAGEIEAYLTGIGIPVAARETEERPPDWRRAKLYLTLLNNPEADVVAGWWLKLTLDAKEANRAILQATAAGMSINEQVLKLPPVTALADVPEALARAGISPQSLQYVLLKLAALPERSGLPNLLLYLAACENATRRAPYAAGVHVGTIHSAKGTEHDTVLLPAFEDELFPGAQDEVYVAEDRRLAFVGFTRARHTLLISHCQRRKTQWGWKPEPARPSRFIGEAGLT